jgi:hypothetical protein
MRALIAGGRSCSTGKDRLKPSPITGIEEDERECECMKKPSAEQA